MSKFPNLSQHGLRKPFNHLDEVVLAMDYSVTLADLNLSAHAAEKAGFVLVIAAIAKRRAGVWTKKSNLKHFEAAEKAISDALEEAQRVKQELIEGKLLESREDIAARAKTMAQDLGDPSVQIDSIGKVQLKFDSFLRDVNGLCEKFRTLDFIDGHDQAQVAFLDYQQTVQSHQEQMEQALSKELEVRSRAFASIDEHIGAIIAEEEFIADFIAWTDDEHRNLSVKNSIDTAAEYVCCALEDAGVLQEYTPVLDAYRLDIGKAHKKLEVQPMLEALETSIGSLKDKLMEEFSYKVEHIAEGDSPEGMLPMPPRLVLSLGQDIDFERLLKDLEGSYQDLRAQAKFNMDLNIDRESPWELNVHYKFQFKDTVDSYPCILKVESHWADNYRGIYSHKRSKNLAIALKAASARELASYDLLLGFLEGRFMPSADGLMKKREKYLATCKFFMDQNMEKDGFHTFAQRNQSFACSSLKQAKNFKGILEKRFADFSLARLSTSHSDIFQARKENRPRHIIFYAGPTNSGKSYMAFEELAKHDKGAYLAPLRLLALEGVEELQKRGKKVSLVTGEERDIVDGATHISQTIETFDRDSHFDCVIIDEIQMISDKGRGGAFMEALLNINADTVVLTGSDNAVDILREICSLTGDEFELRRLERKNPLKWIGEFSIPKGPKDFMKGTAIVAFSKKSIHEIRNQILQSGYTVSVIYGALSPDVRRAEAERFRSGETDILVATDAIGMGLNLPIRRVLFSQSDKFDGERIRDLEPTEVKQIGGRAGRYGMFEEEGEVGIVPGMSKFDVQESVIRDGFRRHLEEVDHVYVSITYKQLQDSYGTLNQELSSIIETLTAKNRYTWDRARAAYIVDKERYEKALLLEKAATRVAKEHGLEKSGTKALKGLEIPFQMIFRLLNTPFDVERYDELLDSCFDNVLRASLSMPLKPQYVDIDTDPIRGSVGLERAEGNVKELTLHYYFASYFEGFEDSPYELSCDEILILRKEVGIQISHYLAKNETMEGIAGHRRPRRGRSSFNKDDRRPSRGRPQGRGKSKPKPEGQKKRRRRR